MTNSPAAVTQPKAAFTPNWTSKKRDTRAGFVHRRRSAVQVSGPEQADETVAQVFALQQHEHGEEKHDRGGRQRAEHRAEPPLCHLKGRGGRVSDLDRHGGMVARRRRFQVRVAGCRERLAGLRAFDLAPRAPQYFRHAADGEALDGFNLALHGRGVARHVGSEAGQLRPDRAAEDEDSARRERHGQQDGRGRAAGHAPTRSPPASAGTTAEPLARSGSGPRRRSGGRRP